PGTDSHQEDAMSTTTTTAARYNRIDGPTEVIHPRPAYAGYDRPRYTPGRFEIDNVARDVPEIRDLDAAKLWTGGVATAVVAALIGLVGTMVVQAVMQVGMHIPAGAAFFGQATVLLCTLAATGALAATGLAHLLILSTPRPLAYLGWIVGLATACAAVLPFLTAAALPLAAATAVIHLVIGMAIGSLVAGAAATARR
ncbi:MAG: hypothetical protein L0H84_21200, partial [Pseudonocardia sp.]|nr:hypothetical protein [Pseudonocardia sp.]